MAASSVGPKLQPGSSQTPHSGWSKIQSAFQCSLLPSALYPRYAAACQRVLAQTSTAPRARGGNTAVYLAKELPEVVLKKCKLGTIPSRFGKMLQVRMLLESLNCSHLIIPKARIHGDFLVEERLPINANCFHNMGLYIAQPTVFDQAVRELTRLYSKIYVSDILSQLRESPLGRVEGVGDYARYDNLPLFIVEGKGRLGLIDLEDAEFEHRKGSLKTLARIFPYHLDLIIEEAETLRVEFDRNALETASANGKKWLQTLFIDHAQWMQQKGISSHSSAQSLKISPEAVHELTSLFESKLVSLANDFYAFMPSYTDDPPMITFTQDPVEVAKGLAPIIAQKIVDNLEGAIATHLQEELGYSEGDLTTAELVNIRSPMFWRSKLHHGVDELLLSEGKIAFKTGFSSLMISDISEQLAFTALEYLVRRGEIFHFDPAKYTGFNNLCWVRY